MIFRTLSILLLCFFVAACGGGGSGGGEAAVSAQGGDAQARFFEQAQLFGSQHCNRSEIRSHLQWEGGVWFYDGARAFFNLARFSGDPTWSGCAQHVIEVYRSYVIGSGGRIGGWRVFPHGLAEHYRQTGAARSREAVELLVRNSPFAQSGGSPDPLASRETAYIIHTYIIAAELLGTAEFDPLLQAAVGNALSHLDAWSVSRTADHVKPFMVGLTAEALIAYYERSPDPRVIEALSNASRFIWDALWDQGSQSFLYISCRPGSTHSECLEPNYTTPDLSLLIAPMYAWLYFQTGQEEFAARADRIFAGGVRGADLTIGKHYSQSYRWGYDYSEWRFGTTSSEN